MQLRGREYRRHFSAAAALHEIYTTGDLAEAIGVSEGTVHGWWRGVKPSAPTLPKIARALDFAEDELFTWVHSGGRPPTLAAPPDLDDNIDQLAAVASRMPPRLPDRRGTKADRRGSPTRRPTA